MENSHRDNSRLIVIGVDGSPESEAALEWVIQKESRDGDAIQVITVHPKEDLLPGASFVPQPHGRHPHRQDSYSADNAVAALIPQHPGSKVTVISVRGDAATELVSASQAADLLVVGARKGGPIGELLLGSVSHECVRRAQCPVVLITTEMVKHLRQAKANSPSAESYAN